MRDNAYRVRAQVDVLMPGGMTAKEQCYRFDEEQLETLGKPEGLTRAELQRGAKNVLNFALTRLE
jgi:beta-glucosidase